MPDETLENTNVRAKAIEDFNDTNTSIYLTTKESPETSENQNNQFFLLVEASITLSDIQISQGVALSSVFGPNEYK